jgi:tryptophan synthase alpha chain
MNRITAKFNELKAQGRTAFIGYLTAGDPSIDKTPELSAAIERGGADIIEIGIPYSDPLADGPIIQQAGLRAFAGGVTVAKVFDAAQRVRESSEVPLLFLVYYNTIYSMGCRKFTERCKEVGIDGLIVPDLPMEERDELKAFTDAHDICLIPLVAPTSKDRVRDIAHGVSGFVYCVSAMGVTGMRSEFRNDIIDYLQDVKSQTDLPIAVGFGIGSREAAEYFSQYADGVIVGSAIVNVIGESAGDAAEVERFVRELSGKEYNI